MSLDKFLMIIKGGPPVNGGVGSGNYEHKPRMTFEGPIETGRLVSTRIDQTKLYKDYQKSDAAVSAHDRYKRDWKKTVTPEQLASVEFYRGAGHLIINPRLRENNPTYVARFVNSTKELQISEEKLKEHIANIRASAKPLPANLIVYRGTSDYKPDYEIGTVLKEKGFTSTSLSAMTVEDSFASSGYLRIALPKGTPVTYGTRDEKEIILMPNARFRVDSLETKDDVPAYKNKIHHLTYLGNDE